MTAARIGRRIKKKQKLTHSRTTEKRKKLVRAMCPIECDIVNVYHIVPCTGYTRCVPRRVRSAYGCMHSVRSKSRHPPPQPRFRSLAVGRTFASTGTEEGDLPHRWRTSSPSTGVAIQHARSEETVIECRPKYSSPSMGPVENMNKELCGLVRCFRTYLREKAKMEITTVSPLLPWLVRKWVDLELRCRER